MDLLSGIREACRLSLRQHPTRSFSKEMIGIPAAHGALMSTTKKPQREGVFFVFSFSIYLVTKDAGLCSIYLKKMRAKHFQSFYLQFLVFVVVVG